MRTINAACVLLAIVAGFPRTGGAEPIEGGSRVAVLAGWRYAFNRRFETQANLAGHPLVRSSPGGPAVQAVFGYRPNADLEVALELGFAHERFDLAGGQESLSLGQIPLEVAFRWAPIVGSWHPYVGGGFGYFLGFFSGGPSGGLESHTQGAFGMAGLCVDLGPRTALIAEYRLALARAAVPGMGFLQVGGNTLWLGAEWSFAPEVRGLP